MTPNTLCHLFEVMHHGKRHFDDFLALDVSKHYELIRWANRKIYRPSKELKIYQAFLNVVLFEHLPINEQVSFAYRKDATLREAIQPHASSQAFYQTDFTKFFDSIDSELIRSKILDGTTPIEDINNYINHIIKLTTIQDRLPIGFVTSPIISNICLKEFDDNLETTCKNNDLKYSRYADDIIISAPSKEELFGIQQIVSQHAKRYISDNFILNESKSKTTRKGRRVQILGFDILPNGRVTVSKQIRSKIEYLIYFFMTDKNRFLNLCDGDIEKGLQQLEGYVSYINSADPYYLSKLRKKFGLTIIDSLLHKSLTNE